MVFPHDLGTAVNVKLWSLAIATNQWYWSCLHEKPCQRWHQLFGESLLNAQGEDVVASIRTLRPIAALETALPQAYAASQDYAKILENHYKDMQDIRFTIERVNSIFSKLNSKRTAKASLKIALDLVDEGIISKKLSSVYLLLRLASSSILYLKKSSARCSFLGSRTASKPWCCNRRDCLYSWAPGTTTPWVKGHSSTDQEASLKTWGHGCPARPSCPVGGGMTSPRGCRSPEWEPAVWLAVESWTSARTARPFLLEILSWQKVIISVDGSSGRIYSGEIPTVLIRKWPRALQRLLSWADEFAQQSPVPT